MLRSQEGLILFPAMSGLAGLLLLTAFRGTLGGSFGLLKSGVTAGLFFVPGLALTYLFLGRKVSLAFHTPLASILSIGAFGVPALPALLSHRSLAAYLAASAVVLSLGLLLLLALRRSVPGNSEASPQERGDIRWWTWTPFAATSAVLILLSATGSITYGHDMWAYLALYEVNSQNLEAYLEARDS